jgi:hypothetical protein
MSVWFRNSRVEKSSSDDTFLAAADLRLWSQQEELHRGRLPSATDCICAYLDCTVAGKSFVDWLPAAQVNERHSKLP